MNHELSLIYHKLVKLERSQILSKNANRAYYEVIEHYMPINNAEKITVKEGVLGFLNSVGIKWVECICFIHKHMLIQITQKYGSREYEKLKQFANS